MWQGALIRADNLITSEKRMWILQILRKSLFTVVCFISPGSIPLIHLGDTRTLLVLLLVMDRCLGRILYENLFWLRLHDEGAIDLHAGPGPSCDICNRNWSWFPGFLFERVLFAWYVHVHIEVACQSVMVMNGQYRVKTVLWATDVYVIYSV